LDWDVTSLDSALNRGRVRAPQFPSGTWFNTDQPLSLAGLRGKIVLLDFWTFCCGNCLHVIDELRQLEQPFADELVIIGVHSPKFDHEAADSAVAAAIERYEVAHPVFNDPDLYLWRQYAIRAWPSLVLIDPEGYVVAQAAGEGQVSGLRAMISQLIQRHEAAGTLARGANPYRPPVPVGGALRFPAKAVSSGDSLLVADAGHHQIVEMSTDAETVLRRFGSGRRGSGPAEFAEPNGLAVLPPALAAQVGFDVVVADTANHLLRGLRLGDGVVVTTVDLAAELAAAGLETVTGPVPAVLSPWDVAYWPAADSGRGMVVVAAAGVHLLLGWQPVTGSVTILAGTTVEGLKDGVATDGWLAQPSGLAVAGDRLWFVDSETSALRYLTVDGQLHTVIGEGLFDFGHRDGPAGQARLQHPLGVTVLSDGTIAVADTYNDAVRRYDPATGLVGTVATGLAEPSGLLEVDGRLLVVESAAHQLRQLALDDAVPVAADRAMSSSRPVTEVAIGALELRVLFAPAPGRALDERYGPATRLSVTGSPDAMLSSGGGDSHQLVRTVELSGPVGTEGVLHVSAQAASCDADPNVEHSACYLARQDWGIPIRLVAADESTETGRTLSLILLG
jgi:thiol-disulfide isomerase/thioredoxin